VVANTGQPGHFGVNINVDKKPFDDERVRKALTLALDRYDMSRTLGPITNLDMVGGLLPPGAPWALTPEELQALPGFAKDHEANLKEAKRLLAEAGYPSGLKTVLTNRSIKLPYIDLGVYVISAWKKIGVEAEHKIEETATYSQTRVNRDFELLIDPYGSQTVSDPDELLTKFISKSPSNWGRFSEPAADKLFDQQKVELDEPKRIQLVEKLGALFLCTRLHRGGGACAWNPDTYSENLRDSHSKTTTLSVPHRSQYLSQAGANASHGRSQ